MKKNQASLIATGGTANGFATLTKCQVVKAVLGPHFDEKAPTLGQ